MNPDEKVDQVEQQQQDNVESDDAFASGFNEVRGNTAAPAKVESPETKEAPKADGAAPAGDPKKPEAPVVDEWAGVPPKVKAEFDSMRTRLDAVAKVPEQLRTINGHIGGLTTATKDLKAAMATAKTATEAKGADAPSKEQVESATKSDARWKQLKEDYPDWAEAVDERLAKLATPAAPAPPVDTSAIKTEVTTDITKTVTQLVKDAKAEARVLARIDLSHDGWEETINSPEFEAWYTTQPKEVKDLSASPKATDAIKMLDLYADHKKKATEKSTKDKRLDRVTSPPGVVATATTISDEDAFVDGFNKARGTG